MKLQVFEYIQRKKEIVSNFGLFSWIRRNILHLSIIKYSSLLSAVLATYMLLRYCVDLGAYRNEKDKLHWKLFNEDKKEANGPLSLIL